MSQNIYFDESGFTGNNLLNPGQRFFAYASVATDDQEAKGFVGSLVKRYGLQNGELKGAELVRFHQGRKAIDEIFAHFGNRLKVSISDKKFALACKLYEYIFEPCCSDINFLSHNANFQGFVANLLYLELAARDDGAEEIFCEFEDLMRTKDETRLPSIFSSSAHLENSLLITYIREIAHHRAGDIRAELAARKGNGVNKWILDLTAMALVTLLVNWTCDKITACDSSKPLQHDQEIFTVMIGREDRVFSDAFGQRHPFVFNLSATVHFVDSKVTHGIQIADVVAAAAVYVASGANDEHAKKWREIIAAISLDGSGMPDLGQVDPEDLRAQRNAELLMELHSRAQRGQSLVDGMAEYAELISRRLLAQ